MNLMFDFINELVSGAEQRMDAAGIPLVRRTCDFCRGSGLREIGKGPLATLDRCAACNAKGFLVTDRIDEEAA